MFQRYEKEILPHAEDDLERLSARLRAKRVALLRYETDASDCHRSYVARCLGRCMKSEIKIVDLGLEELVPNSL